MRNIKLTIEYDGTNYAGWQKQKNALAIQEVLEGALYKVTGEAIEVIGSSRTDAGVHARGFVGNFHSDSSIPGEKFKNAINSMLPSDIVIIKSEDAASEFHARFDSIGKRYKYYILNRNEPSAIYRNFIFHYRPPLDVKLMRSACSYFIGTHDFAAFRSLGSSAKTTVRNISKLEIVKEGDILIIDIAGNGFLYNMVRIIAGTLINVGRAKTSPAEIPEIIESKDRTRAGSVLPARGLCLEEVYY